MTTEEKQLLLQDLCGRIPYNVKFNLFDNTYTLSGIQPFTTDLGFWNYGVTSKESGKLREIDDIKLYLRKMSSMTSEEKEEFNKIYYKTQGSIVNSVLNDGYSLAFTELTDWLNAHHFDYRGLIEKGLAIEAPKDMYN